MRAGPTSLDGNYARVLDPDLTALVVANVVPIVGIVVFDLSILGLLALYWLELGIVCFWAIVRATFAGRPMERNGDPLILGALNAKRTGISVPGTAAEIRLMTIPTLLFVTPILIALWLFVGALVVGPVAAATPDAGLSPWLAVGALGILVAEGGRTLTGYFRDGGYREHNAATALQSVLTEGMTVLFASVVALVVAYVVVSTGGGAGTPRALERAAAGPLVAVVVSVRLLTDLAGHYYDGRIGAGLWSLLGRGDAYSPPARESVDVTMSGTPDLLAPPRLGRLLPTVSHVRAHPGPWLLAPIAVLAAALAASEGTTRIALWALVVGVGGPVALVHLDYWIRYAGVEYQTDGTAVVATDRLFRTDLWRRESRDVTEVRLERDAVDRWLGTSTVIVDCSDRAVRLPRLRDPAPIVEVLAAPGRSDATTSPEPDTDEPATTTEVGRALIRLDETVGAGRSIVAIGLLALVVPVALVLAAQFEGGVAAGVFVLVFGTLPLVAVIVYQLLS